tara:strand:- start:549 stop:1916 length:1368 start_codon:yes stop_codon:yes gene_type:complete
VKYLSTRNNKIEESFLNILFQGLSKDGGLFLPKTWPKISIEELKTSTYQEIAYVVTKPYLENEISNQQLITIIDKAYKNFRNNNIAPLISLNDNKYILELFYGPTFAFKDYALQFLGNLFSAVLQNKKKKITILGATSGDTGSAAINAFKGKNDIQVFILHPYEKISEVQRRQMTTVTEKNVHNIAIKGTFDDCQKIVKNLFMNEELQSQTSLTAINSINWARLIAQTVYYFWAYVQLKQERVNFIVPSGNFGNIFSARIAKYMGLPINKLHIVTNTNDILHRTIRTGIMKTNEVKQTLSPSMDIQVSSNFERQLFESCDRDSGKIKKIMKSFTEQENYELEKKILSNLQSTYLSYSVSNKETLETIKIFKEEFDYLADPHTATGLNVLNKIKDDYPTVSLACAHPAKFGDAIKKATGKTINLPYELENIFDKDEKIAILDNSITDTKNYILKFL